VGVGGLAAAFVGVGATLILPVQLVLMINAKTIKEPGRHGRDAGRSHDPLRLEAGLPG
jgi:hypothetical protein